MSLPELTDTASRDPRCRGIRQSKANVHTGLYQATLSLPISRHRVLHTRMQDKSILYMFALLDT